jgi:hypothetical protein
MTTPLLASRLFDDPGELIAAIPSLLSFRPTNSLVLITYSGARRLRLEAVLRMDLPDPKHHAEVVDQLRVIAHNQSATVVELVMLGGRRSKPPRRLPHRRLVKHLVDALNVEEIDLAHAVWTPHITPGKTWWCYFDPECTGKIRDPTASPSALARAVSGAVTFDSREDMAALLTPDDPESLTRRSELIATASDVEPERDYRFVRALIADPPATLDDQTVARLATILSHRDVREACLALALTVRAGPAEKLWTTLTRAVPGPARAEPAALLAVSAYLRGEGALAMLAVEAALAASPDHLLATSVRTVLEHGLPPPDFRLLLAESFAAAFTPPD